MNVFGYIRVSGVNQIDGDGFDRQRESIQAFCDRKGWRVLRWFEERGVSGTTASEARPAYTEMIELAGPGTAEAIVVERADRLARDLIVSELACNAAREKGLKIIEAASDTVLTDNTDPTRVLFRQMLGALAEWNKNVIVSRLRIARERKRKETGKCEGRIAYGSRGITNEEEAKALVERLHNEGWSLGRITKELNRREIPTPQYSSGRSKSILDLGVPKWQKSTVHVLVNRYKEQLRHAKHKKEFLKPNRILAGLSVE